MPEQSAEQFSKDFNTMQAKRDAEQFSKEFNTMQAEQLKKEDDKPKPKSTASYSPSASAPSTSNPTPTMPEVEDNEGPPMALIIGATVLTIALGTTAYFILR